jgi:hypothetical protein
LVTSLHHSYLLPARKLYLPVYNLFNVQVCALGLQSSDDSNKSSQFPVFSPFPLVRRGMKSSRIFIYSALLTRNEE